MSHLAFDLGYGAAFPAVTDSEWRTRINEVRSEKKEDFAERTRMIACELSMTVSRAAAETI
jgi:hypothetical protein